MGTIGIGNPVTLKCSSAQFSTALQSLPEPDCSKGGPYLAIDTNNLLGKTHFQHPFSNYKGAHFAINGHGRLRQGNQN